MSFDIFLGRIYFILLRESPNVLRWFSFVSLLEVMQFDQENKLKARSAPRPMVLKTAGIFDAYEFASSWGHLEVISYTLLYLSSFI